MIDDLIADFGRFEGPHPYLAARAFRTSPRPGLANRWFIISLSLVVCYALLDEYHQSFVPSRTASIYDSFIDMTGGLVALLVIRLRHKSRPPFNKTSRLIV